MVGGSVSRTGRKCRSIARRRRCKVWEGLECMKEFSFAKRISGRAPEHLFMKLYEFYLVDEKGHAQVRSLRCPGITVALANWLVQVWLSFSERINRSVNRVCQTHSSRAIVSPSKHKPDLNSSKLTRLGAHLTERSPFVLISHASPVMAVAWLLPALLSLIQFQTHDQLLVAKPSRHKVKGPSSPLITLFACLCSSP